MFRARRYKILVVYTYISICKKEVDLCKMAQGFKGRGNNTLATKAFFKYPPPPTSFEILI